MSLQARSGIERSGASRANYFTCNAVFLINSVDISAYVLFDTNSPKLSPQTNNQPSTASFSITIHAPVMPVEDQRVSICLGASSNPEFSGVIRTVTSRTFQTSDGSTAFFLDLYCVDEMPRLLRRLINAEYVSASASDIADDLIDQSGSGCSRASVARGLPTIDDFVVSNEYAADALTRLIGLFSGQFVVDAEPNVHLFGVAGDPSPKAGTNPLPIAVTQRTLKSANGVQFTTDGSQKRTRTIVEGKSTTTPISTPSGETTTSSDVSQNVDWLVVGPGAGGGSDRGGGGGGGQVVAGTDTLTTGSYAVVVATGGAAETDGAGSSSFNGHAAAPGHAGSGGVAGSGGTSGAGYPGGTGWDPHAAPSEGGGGGGAGGAGGSADSGQIFLAAFGGNGGPGVSSSLSGSPVGYGGGGGGASDGGPDPGLGADGGGGGSNTSSAGADGTANRGGGGGGGGFCGGGGGWDGVVILSYPTGTIDATGGTITTVAGRTIHTFTSTDTFVISQSTVTSMPEPMTDLPLADATQIDAAAGTVRIGNLVTDYLSTGGAIVAAGANPPGTTVSSDTAAGATSVALTDSAQITSAPGWVQVGEQYIRFGSVGGGSISGIPASGVGSFTAAVKAGAQVTWLGHINLPSDGVTFIPGLAAGATVVQRVTVDDLVAQGQVASRDGSDGIIEHFIDAPDLSIAGCQSLGSADLQDFSSSIQTAEWDTDDLNARPGRLQTFSFAGLPSVTLVISSADITFLRQNEPPRRHCAATTVRVAALLDVTAHAAG